MRATAEHMFSKSVDEPEPEPEQAEAQATGTSEESATEEQKG